MCKGFAFYKDVLFTVNGIEYVAKARFHGCKDTGYLSGPPESCTEPDVQVDYKVHFIDGIDFNNPLRKEIYDAAEIACQDYIDKDFKIEGE